MTIILPWYIRIPMPAWWYHGIITWGRHSKFCNSKVTKLKLVFIYVALLPDQTTLDVIKYSFPCLPPNPHRVLVLYDSFFESRSIIAIFDGFLITAFFPCGLAKIEICPFGLLYVECFVDLAIMASGLIEPSPGSFRGRPLSFRPGIMKSGSTPWSG